ncbi:hypothetical protein A2U01_0005589 [Trifolium medium]|uniref:Uncharacterized protein n=1 Tax=Trifolium medium TaxID=97028 RepID=A0A392MC77_9FABA|nr:hypothetical protein [Trifolium medium]
MFKESHVHIFCKAYHSLMDNLVMLFRSMKMQQQALNSLLTLSCKMNKSYSLNLCMFTTARQQATTHQFRLRKSLQFGQRSAGMEERSDRFSHMSCKLILGCQNSFISRHNSHKTAIFEDPASRQLAIAHGSAFVKFSFQRTMEERSGDSLE